MNIVASMQLEKTCIGSAVEEVKMCTDKRISNNLALTTSQALEIQNKEETEMLAGENDLEIDSPAASSEVQQVMSL